MIYCPYCKRDVNYTTSGIIEGIDVSGNDIYTIMYYYCVICNNSIRAEYEK